MKDIIFSSWGGRIIDNRGKEPRADEPAGPFALPACFRGEEKIKALVGWDGIIIRSAGVDLLDLLRAYLETVYEHSRGCDKCNYCKTGWKEQLEVFQDIYNGEASESDLEFMQSSAEAIVDAGKCSIGKAGPAPILHALKHFRDAFTGSLKGKGPAEGVAYHSKTTAPCIDACPIHLDIPRYIEKIKDAKFDESLRVIRERLPLPGVVGRVCVRSCEEHCRRANVDDPISIRALKRFVADQEFSANREPDFQVTPSNKVGKVAVIGSGPAGITCAFHLGKKGHRVTIFEKLPVPGGMMAVGIPRYCLPMEILDSEIRSMEKLGVSFKTGVSFGDEITLDALKSDGFDAVFLGPGLHGARNLGVAGEDLGGILSGIQFLRDVALGKKVHLGKRVVVIGGGNVAVDVARTAARLGEHDVTMVSLESSAEMPAWKHEIEGAKEEGIQILNCFGPKAFSGLDGKVGEITLKRCTRVFDQDKRFDPQYDETDLRTIAADSVILSIGQSAGPDFEKFEGIPVSRGALHADPVTFQTDLRWVFSGGDALYGPDSVIRAAASGMKAADSIDRFLNDLPVEPEADDHFDALFRSIPVYDPKEQVKQKVEKAERRQITRLPPEGRRSGFEEIEQGFSTPDAVAEAERCLRCYRVVTVVV